MFSFKWLYYFVAGATIMRGANSLYQGRAIVLDTSLGRPDKPAVWDNSKYNELKSILGAARTAEYLELFLNELIQCREALACSGMDLASLKKLAHNIRAVGGVLGFAGLAAACKEIEAFAGTDPTELMSVFAENAERALRSSYKPGRRCGNDHHLWAA